MHIADLCSLALCPGHIETDLKKLITMQSYEQILPSKVEGMTKQKKTRKEMEEKTISLKFVCNRDRFRLEKAFIMLLNVDVDIKWKIAISVLCNMYSTILTNAYI